jgi:hypothetical protein
MVTLAAFQRNIAIYVFLVIEFDRCRIGRAVSQGRKFGVPMGEALDGRRHLRLSRPGPEIRVAPRAGLVFSGYKLLLAPMFHVAVGACRRKGLRIIVNRPVVA